MNKGYNTDGKAWSVPASVEGIEGLDTDASSTLYDAVVECRVIKTPQEIAIMQHITNLSSEAHFEVRRTVTTVAVEYVSLSVVYGTYRVACLYDRKNAFAFAAASAPGLSMIVCVGGRYVSSLSSPLRYGNPVTF